MFLENILDEFYYEELINNYDFDYLCSLDEKNFYLVIKVFHQYGFDYIEDIILRYIEIFEMDSSEVEEGIIKLKNNLGDNFVNIIGRKMSLLEEVFDV